MQIYQFCCQEYIYASGRAAVRMRAKQTERNNSECKYAFYDSSKCKGTIVMGKYNAIKDSHNY